MKTTTHAEARDYYRLCDEARSLGIPVSLDDPDSPKTVEQLREAIVAQYPRDAERPSGTSGSWGEA